MIYKFTEEKFIRFEIVRSRTQKMIQSRAKNKISEFARS